jgi:hypothetical protein
MKNAQCYSILYEKILMDHLGLFVYRPLEVIEGKLIEVDGQKIFTTEANEYFYLNYNSNDDNRLDQSNQPISYAYT